MSERHDIVLSQDGDSPLHGRMARLVRSVSDAKQWIKSTLRPQKAVKQLRDDGLRMVKGKADEQDARAANIKAAAVKKIRQYELDKEHLRIEATKAQTEGDARLIELEISKRKAMGDFIRDMIDRGMDVEAAVKLSERVYGV